VETQKGLTLVDPRIKESNQPHGIIEHHAASATNSTLASAEITQCDVLDVAKRVIKWAIIPRLSETEGRVYKKLDQETLNLQHLKGDPC